MKNVYSFDSCSRFIYPALVSLFIATLYFPPGLGQFLVSTLTTRQQIISLFSNFTWMSEDLTAEQAQIVGHWTNDYSNLFVTLGIYMVATVRAITASGVREITETRLLIKYIFFPFSFRSAVFPNCPRVYTTRSFR